MKNNTIKLFLITILTLFIFTSCEDSSAVLEMENNLESLKLEKQELISQIEDLTSEKEKLKTKYDNMSVNYDDTLADLTNLIIENDNLKTENSNLSKSNNELKEKADILQGKLNDIKKETTVQEGDVTVILTKKYNSSEKFRDYIINFEYSITNNTDKTIRGIQGVATFKDIFGVSIKPFNCDFTGISIKPNETYTYSDLWYECNQFNNEDMKLYSTRYEDIILSYKTTMIVFEDGTSKAN